MNDRIRALEEEEKRIKLELELKRQVEMIRESEKKNKFDDRTKNSNDKKLRKQKVGKYAVKLFERR